MISLENSRVRHSRITFGRLKSIHGNWVATDAIPALRAHHTTPKESHYCNDQICEWMQILTMKIDVCAGRQTIHRKIDDRPTSLKNKLSADAANRPPARLTSANVIFIMARCGVAGNDKADEIAHAARIALINWHVIDDVVSFAQARIAQMLKHGQTDRFSRLILNSASTRHYNDVTKFGPNPFLRIPSGIDDPSATKIIISLRIGDLRALSEYSERFKIRTAPDCVLRDGDA